MRRLLASLERGLDRLEGAIAVGGLLLMLVLAFTEIIARNFFATGFPVADTLLRYLVLLVSFSGAVLAVRERRHIKIDVALHWMAAVWRRRLERGFHLLSCLVCAIFAWAAARFWAVDWEYASPPEKWVAGLGLILPISFALLATHFLLRALLLGSVENER